MKTERMELKTNALLKQTLEQAAALEGTNLTAFVLSAAAEKARQVMLEKQFLALSASGWQRLNQSLTRRTTPTQALTALFEEKDFCER